MNQKTKARAKASATVDSAHEFTLVLDADALSDEMADRLFEAGCSDATLVRRSGETLLMFDRIASTYLDAVSSAIRDVQKAGFQVARIAADDMVSQADVARKIGRSRQVVSLYIAGKRGPGGFPAPELGANGEHALWRWNKVSAWLNRSGLASEHMAHEAAMNNAVNVVLGYHCCRRSDPEFFDSLVNRIFGGEEPASIHEAHAVPSVRRTRRGKP